MVWIIWGVVLPSSLVVAWLLARRPIRMVVGELQVDQARFQFRRRREWLEVRFLDALGRVDPIERLRWEGARWQDPIHWARDNQTFTLLALVEVHFEPDPFDGTPEHAARHATALFEYRKGQWVADGKRLDATRPDEALRRPSRYHPVTPPPRPA